LKITLALFLSQNEPLIANTFKLFKKTDCEIINIMKIVFLNTKEAINEFVTPDEYALRLPKSNLDLINYNNPTLEGYQEIFLKSFRNFTKKEKDKITKYTEKLKWLNLDVKIIKTGGTHLFDITQTRKDIILITKGEINEETFIHECFHVLSRKNPSLTMELSQIFGFTKVEEQEIDSPDYILNPDATICDYAINVVHNETKENLQVSPYLGESFKTELKVIGEEKYLLSSETNYQSLIKNTTYIAHPEEICAEYFTLIHLGFCVFYQYSDDESQIIQYRDKIKVILNKLGLIIGQFPENSI
jgi:hypothetical protein